MMLETCKTKEKTRKRISKQMQEKTERERENDFCNKWKKKIEKWRKSFFSDRIKHEKMRLNGLKSRNKAFLSGDACESNN